MKETPIFRNIQHIPRIWGVTDPKLFASLGGGLLVTTVGSLLASAGTAILKVALIGFGILSTAIFYALCFAVDNTDRLQRDSAPFIKGEMNSQSLSLQRISFVDREGIDALSRHIARP